TGTSKSAPASRVYQLPGGDDLFCGGRFRERHLAEESAEGTLARIERKELSPILLVFVPVMQGAGDPAIIQRWLEAASQETDSRLKAEYASLAKVLVDLTDWA